MKLNVSTNIGGVNNMELTYVDLVNQSNPDFVIRCHTVLSKEDLLKRISSGRRILLGTHNGDTLVVTKNTYNNFLFIIIADKNIQPAE